MTHHRRLPPRRSAAGTARPFFVAAALLLTVAAPLPRGSVHAFSAPLSLSPSPSTGSRHGMSGRRPAFLAATENDDDDDHRPIAEFSLRPILTAATSAFLAASLLLSDPLLHRTPPPARAAAPPASSATATSIDIDLRSLPALTRKAIANREKLTNYLIESFKSFRPILDLLSESDAVTVRPPADVRGAINRVLTKGDAQFLVNGESVDVRVESVPGVVVVRIVNPNIPRLPFLRDGTAALKFVDDIVDVAPRELEKAAEEVQAIEKFLMWGAPQKAPIQYKGSSLDYFLRGKFAWNGDAVSLGPLGDMTNSEVVFVVLGAGIGGAYSLSYAYYVSLREEAERETEEKKAKVAAKKKAKAAADAKAKVNVAAAVEKKEEEEGAAQVAKVESAYSRAAAEDGGGNDGGAGEETATGGAPSSKGRKRDAIKNMFRRKQR